ncbi:unnamed protein product [Amoebophrya sp. A120]|nr:unnamed protein product [Amoebophrya sp. A120]|eukprot:GSA120T00014454001.1
MWLDMITGRVLRLLCLVTGTAVLPVKATVTTTCPPWYGKQDRKKADGSDILESERNAAFDFYGAYDLNMQEERTCEIADPDDDACQDVVVRVGPTSRLITTTPGAGKLQVYGATAHAVAVQSAQPGPDYPQLYDGLLGRWGDGYDGTSSQTTFNGLEHATSACPWYQMQLVPSPQSSPVSVGKVRVWLTGGDWVPGWGTPSTYTNEQDLRPKLDHLTSLFEKGGLRVKVANAPRARMSTEKNGERSYETCPDPDVGDDEKVCGIVTLPGTAADPEGIAIQSMPVESAASGSGGVKMGDLFKPLYDHAKARHKAQAAFVGTRDLSETGQTEDGFLAKYFDPVHPVQSSTFKAYGAAWWLCSREMFYVDVDCQGKEANYVIVEFPGVTQKEAEEQETKDTDGVLETNPAKLRTIRYVDEIEVYAPPAVQCATGEHSLEGQQKKCYPNVCTCTNGDPLVTGASSGEICKGDGLSGCRECHPNFVLIGAESDSPACSPKQLCAAAFGGASGQLSCPVGKALTPDASARCAGTSCTVAADAATCCQLIGSCGSGFHDGCPTQAALLGSQMCADAEACTKAECCQSTCEEADADSSVREACREAAESSAGAGIKIRGFAQWKLCPADGSACDSAEHCCVTAEEGASEDLRARMQNLYVALSSTLSPERFATLMDEVGTNEATAATFFRLVENGVRTLHKQPEVVVPWLTDAGVPTAFLMQQANLVKITGSQSEVVQTFPASDSSRTRSRSRNLLHADRGLSAASASSSYAVRISSYGLYLEDGVASSTAELEAALERFENQLTAAGVAEALSDAFAADSSNTFRNTEVAAASVTSLPTRVAPPREVESANPASTSSSTTSTTTEPAVVAPAATDDGTVYVDEDNAWWVAVLVIVVVVLAFFGGSYVKSGRAGGGWAQSSWSQAGKGSSWAGPRKGGGSYGHWSSKGAAAAPQSGSWNKAGRPTSPSAPAAAWGKSASTSPGGGGPHAGPKGNKGGPKGGKWRGESSPSSYMMGHW